MFFFATKQVDQLKEANSIGLIVTPFTFEQYPFAIERTEHLIKAAGRKLYQLSTNHLGQDILDYFPEIDAFVLLACPFTLSKISSRSFLSPVANLFCVEKAFNDDNFNYDLLEYSLDLNHFKEGKKGNLVAALPDIHLAQTAHKYGDIISREFYDKCNYKICINLF